MLCSRWHQVVKWQRTDWIIIWFDPVMCELSPMLQQVPKVCAGIAALQHNSHLAMTAVGITVVPQCLYQWRTALKSWRDFKKGRWTEPLDPLVSWMGFSLSTCQPGTIMSVCSKLKSMIVLRGTWAQHMLIRIILPPDRHTHCLGRRQRNKHTVCTTWKRLF